MPLQAGGGVAATALVAGLLAASAPPGLEPLRTALERAVAGAGGVAGVAVLHVESGQRVSLRGAEPFPMASVFKLPVALTALRRVEEGSMRLDQGVRLAASDYRTGPGKVGEQARRSDTVSIRELLEPMLVDSDNTAGDVLLRLVGGPSAVTARMKQLGIDGVRVDRSEGEVMRAFAGDSAATRRAAILESVKDPRDTATPDAVVDLLALAQRGRTLSPPSTELLLRMMAASTTGSARLRAGLPPATTLAHKTGTGAEAGGVNLCTNDVGLIALPDGSHLAVAVFVRHSRQPLAARERAIAEVARAAWDHFARPSAPRGL